MTVFGIDLGTTYSCIAHIDDSGRAVVIKNSDGDDTTPSVVWFEDEQSVAVGKSAKGSAVAYPDQVVSLIKREMGTDRFATFFGRRYTPEEISSLILRRLAGDAGQMLNTQVRDVVITVPAYFGIAERDATRKAGQIAGLEVLDIVSEPIAAAIDYGVLNAAGDATILVYDLGGGTFDTTVIRLEGGDIEVVCTGGDHRLGGADWDERLLEYLVGEFQRQHPAAGDPRDDAALYQDLSTDAEDIKRALSTAQKRPQRVAHGGATALIEVTREIFESQTRDLLDRTVKLTEDTLEIARSKGVSALDDVILVGGATRMPAVAAAVEGLVGRKPRIHDPDLAVAKGAARYGVEEKYRHLIRAGRTTEAAALARNFTPQEQRRMAARSIVTVAPRGFGVRIVEDAAVSLDRMIVDHLIHANDQLPATRQRTYRTVVDNQGGVIVELFEQKGPVESPEVDDNDLVVEGVISDIPPLPKDSPIEVRFDMDRNGILELEAVEPASGRRVELKTQIGVMTHEQVDQSRTELAGLTVSN